MPTLAHFARSLASVVAEASPRADAPRDADTTTTTVRLADGSTAIVTVTIADRTTHDGRRSRVLASDVADDMLAMVRF